jgi:hypothetical protein
LNDRGRLRARHATIVAYLALFVAILGTGFAAGRLTNGRSARRTVALESASHRHKSRRGPRGPRGFTGAPGQRGPKGDQGDTGGTGPSGPTVFSTGPAWSDRSTSGTGSGAPCTGTSLYGPTVKNWQGEDYDEFDQCSPGTAGHAVDQLWMPIAGDSELSGSAQHLSSVRICYFLVDVTGGITLDKIDLVQQSLPSVSDPSNATGANPGGGFAPNGGTLTTLTSATVPAGTPDAKGYVAACPTITFSPAAPAVDPNGTLMLQLQLSHGWNSYNAYVMLGRVTYTFTP